GRGDAAHGESAREAVLAHRDVGGVGGPAVGDRDRVGVGQTVAGDHARLAVVLGDREVGRGADACVIGGCVVGGVVVGGVGAHGDGVGLGAGGVGGDRVVDADRGEAAGHDCAQVAGEGGAGAL